MIEIADIDALPLATEFNVDDLLVKVNRGGGPVVLEKLTFQVLRTALGDLSIAASQLPLPRVASISQTVLVSDFTDGGAASGTKTLTSQIPAGAIFLYSRTLVNVACSGDTTAVLTIGDGSDVDRYNTGTPSVFTTGQKEMGNPSGARDHASATTVTLTLTGGSDFGAINAAGSLTVALYYIQTA